MKLMAKAALPAGAVVLALCLSTKGQSAQDLHAPSLAQSDRAVGGLISAEEPTPEHGYIPLIEAPQSIGVPEGTEFIFISGYEPSGRGPGDNSIRITVDRPSRHVVLVLTSCEPAVWEVDATPLTDIAAVLIGGCRDGALKSTLKLDAYSARIPYAYETDNAKFRKALLILQDTFGIEAIHHHFGSYRLPATVEVQRIGNPQPAFHVNWPPVEPPAVQLDFLLLRQSLRQVPWSVAGPRGEDDGDLLPPETVAMAPGGRTAYRIASGGIRIIDTETGEDRLVPLPPNFTRFSHPKGIAYDARNDMVAIATSGGPGAFYRFDAKRDRWRDFRSFNGVVDVDSLSYDPEAGVYVAARFHRPGLIVLSEDGYPLSTRDLAKALPGLGRIYDRRNGPVPVLSLVPRGRHVAILAMNDPLRIPRMVGPQGVRRIWLYDMDTGTAQLTYKRD